jgi:hypothetical protein
VSCRLADGHLALHFGTRAAAADTGLRTSDIAPMFRGHQSQCKGYTFRYATEEEVVAGTPLEESSDARMAGRLLVWARGGLDEDLRAILARRSRGGRYDKSNASGFIGVTRTVGRPTWSAYYIDDPVDRSSPTFLGRDYPDPASASAAREAFLNADPALRALNQRGGPKGTRRRS